MKKSCFLTFFNVKQHCSHSLDTRCTLHLGVPQKGNSGRRWVSALTEESGENEPMNRRKLTLILQVGVVFLACFHPQCMVPRFAPSGAVADLQKFGVGMARHICCSEKPGAIATVAILTSQDCGRNQEVWQIPTVAIHWNAVLRMVAQPLRYQSHPVFFATVLT
ncbi:hypothetical protein FN846DRAFT_535043 [Sphaerosporella brunnea]|uniref:Uncharacterized protein n=1 Tax=Sphaerosporella brunnea TaxID=1250544 RepID=A0A5J5F2S0_9PEZI|nr:hypothetical protein FN846DRAFT_535043 [Sphaerosporella brunnea]